VAKVGFYVFGDVLVISEVEIAQKFLMTLIPVEDGEDSWRQ